jgi:hypothetical protein
VGWKTAVGILNSSFSGSTASVSLVFAFLCLCLASVAELAHFLILREDGLASGAVLCEAVVLEQVLHGIISVLVM